MAPFDTIVLMVQELLSLLISGVRSRFHSASGVNFPVSAAGDICAFARSNFIVGLEWKFPCSRWTAVHSPLKPFR